MDNYEYYLYLSIKLRFFWGNRYKWYHHQEDQRVESNSSKNKQNQLLSFLLKFGEKVEERKSFAINTTTSDVSIYIYTYMYIQELHWKQWKGDACTKNFQNKESKQMDIHKNKKKRVVVVFVCVSLSKSLEREIEVEVGMTLNNL